MTSDCLMSSYFDQIQFMDRKVFLPPPPPSMKIEWMTDVSGTSGMNCEQGEERIYLGRFGTILGSIIEFHFLIGEHY